MSLRKKPVLEQRVRLAYELFQFHLDKASAAQTAEELLGDLVHATELNSQLFANNFHRLNSLYNLLLNLQNSGCIPLVYVDYLFIHLNNHVLTEMENVRYRQHLLPLEAAYDDLHNHHTTLASNTQLNLLTLLAVRDKILLRAQGHPATPLADVNITFI